MTGAAKSLIRFLEPALMVSAILAAAWACWATALGDRSTAMVVALSATSCACAAMISRLSQGRRAMLVAAAAGVSPAIAFATARTLSTPLMGQTEWFGIGTERAAIEPLLIGGGLAAICAGIGARAARRSRGRWAAAALTWAPAVILAGVLGMTLAQGWTQPSPEDYAAAQPVLAHMEPERSGGLLVVDEIERTDGVILVRVCEKEPWCHTLLRRGNHVTSHLGHVDRDAVIHLRFDPNHQLYLVESQGRLVASVEAETLASYSVLFPTTVRRSLSPPFSYQVLAGLGVVAVLVIALMRRRLARRTAMIDLAQSGVCFGEGWALLSDGTALRVPGDLARGPILVSWAARTGAMRERALTVLLGAREEIHAAAAGQRRQLDALQQAFLWTLGTPLLIAAAMV